MGRAGTRLRLCRGRCGSECPRLAGEKGPEDAEALRASLFKAHHAAPLEGDNLMCLISCNQKTGEPFQEGEVADNEKIIRAGDLIRYWLRRVTWVEPGC